MIAYYSVLLLLCFCSFTTTENSMETLPVFTYITGCLEITFYRLIAFLPAWSSAVQSGSYLSIKLGLLALVG